MPRPSSLTRTTSACGAVVLDQKLDPAAAGVAEGVAGDLRDRGRDRGSGPAGRSRAARRPAARAGARPRRRASSLDRDASSERPGSRRPCSAATTTVTSSRPRGNRGTARRRSGVGCRCAKPGIAVERPAACRARRSTGPGAALAGERVARTPGSRLRDVPGGAVVRHHAAHRVGPAASVAGDVADAGEAHAAAVEVEPRRPRPPRRASAAARGGCASRISDAGARRGAARNVRRPRGPPPPPSGRGPRPSATSSVSPSGAACAAQASPQTSSPGFGRPTAPSGRRRRLRRPRLRGRSRASSAVPRPGRE